MNSIFNNVYFMVVTIAIFFGPYPVIVRKSGLPQAWVVFILGMSGAVIGAASIFWSKQSQTSHLNAAILASITTIIVFFIVIPRTGMPLYKALLIGFGASLWNGIGTYFYGKLITSNLQLSVSMPLMITCMILVSASCAILFLHEPITVRKIIGVTTAALAGYLLSA